MPAAARATSNPIVSALHEMAASALSEQLREMFEKADDILFDSAEKARNGTEQQLYYDTMRTVRMQRARIMTSFRESLQKALLKLGEESSKAGAPSPEDLKLMDRETVEEMIAVRNMEQKAASLHSHELVELQRRLARLADMTHGALSPEAMSPARIIKAFQDSIQGLSVEFPIKLVIFKLFDRLVVGRLSEVIASANQLLARHGVEQKIDPKAAAMRRAPSAAAPRSAGGTAAPGDPAPAWASAIDTRAFEQAMSFLQTAGAASANGAGLGVAEPGAGNWNAWSAMGAQAGTGPGGAASPFWQGVAREAIGYSDTALMRDVGNVLASLADGRWPAAPPWLPAPNVALVARMFDSYYRDPRLNDQTKPMLGLMQLPVTKAALADRKFFTDPAHPARRAANDLFEILLQFSAAGATASPQAYGELEGLVRSMAQALDLDPSKLRALETPAVDDLVADNFLRDQEEHLQQRNRAKVERVRRMVAHELRRRIGGSQLPKGVMRLMLSGFGPLLTLDYIRHGFGGHSWNETMELVDRVLASLGEVSGSAEERAAQEAEVVAAISRRLSNIGFSEAKLQEVLSGLLQAYLDRAGRAGTGAVRSGSGDEPAEQPGTAEAAPAPAEPVPAPVLSPEQELHQLLFIVLVPGVWCTITDRADKKKYWVRVKSYYPTHNSMVLSHYMEERFLTLRATSFATALVEGYASVIDPSPELRDAIARIAELSFPRESEPLVWTTLSAPTAAAA